MWAAAGPCRGQKRMVPGDSLLPQLLQPAHGLIDLAWRGEVSTSERLILPLIVDSMRRETHTVCPLTSLRFNRDKANRFKRNLNRIDRQAQAAQPAERRAVSPGFH